MSKQTVPSSEEQSESRVTTVGTVLWFLIGFMFVSNTTWTFLDRVLPRPQTYFYRAECILDGRSIRTQEGTASLKAVDLVALRDYIARQLDAGGDDIGTFCQDGHVFLTALSPL